MPDQVVFALTLLCVLGCGLIGGIFFAFSTFIMKALARVSSEEGMRVMQSINVTVLTPWFLSVFFGTAILCLVMVIHAFMQGSQGEALWRMGGSVFYILGTFLVTAVFNVPRNERLAKLTPDDDDGKDYWATYLASWTNWNHVRTVAAVIAAMLFSIALSF